MGALIQLGIYAALIGGALFAVHSAWTGFKDKIGAPYTQAQMQADQQVIDKANKAQSAAEAEREHAKADTEACLTTMGTQKRGIDEWKAAADRNAKAAKEAKAQASRDATAAAPLIADLQAKAAAQPKLMACTDELAKAREILRQSLCARRGIQCPPGTAPPSDTAVKPPVLTK